jgi:hypothetical protein
MAARRAHRAAPLAPPSWPRDFRDCAGVSDIWGAVSGTRDTSVTIWHCASSSWVHEHFLGTAASAKACKAAGLLQNALGKEEW